MRWDLFLACCGREGVDVKAYEAFHTTLDMAAVYDVIEMRQVQDSWIEAGRDNAAAEAEMAHAAVAATKAPRRR